MRPYTPPQAFETTPRPPIPLARVKSHQIAAAGHSAELAILALQFHPRKGETEAAVYCYPGVSTEQYEAFLASDSLGKYHGANFKPMIFKKYPPETLPPEV